ncbi:MAG: hypothetical protein EOO09_14970 [Chitinophagaceae bacterium]|nr:MAG: hypothetical protein EOO09_14970 [Chitinophagaceae bacterium]
MQLPVRIFRFFIFSNLFISLCAAAMGWHSLRLNGLTVTPACTWFIFFATLASYSFHWMLTTEWPGETARTQWQRANPRVHGVLLLLSLPGAIFFAWQLRQHWPILCLTGFLTFLYSAPKIPHTAFHALRRIALGKTLFLAIVWTMATALLPLETNAGGWPAGALLFALNRFFLVYAICILFDLRDLEYDRRNGIRSLVTWLTPTGVRNLFILSLLLFTATACQMLAFGHSVAAIVNILLPGIATGLLYSTARRSQADMLYYFLLDGLMALAAFASWMVWLAGGKVI